MRAMSFILWFRINAASERPSKILSFAAGLWHHRRFQHTLGRIFALINWRLRNHYYYYFFSLAFFIRRMRSKWIVLFIIIASYRIVYCFDELCVMFEARTCAELEAYSLQLYSTRTESIATQSSNPHQKCSAKCCECGGFRLSFSCRNGHLESIHLYFMHCRKRKINGFEMAPNAQFFPFHFLLP